MKDGPSTLQKRPEVKTHLEQQSEGSKLKYEQDQNDHKAKQAKYASLLNQLQSHLNGEEVIRNTGLRDPRDARKEIQELAQQMRDYKEFKTAGQFLSKRDRILKGGWRHGVLGIEDADSE